MYISVPPLNIQQNCPQQPHLSHPPSAKSQGSRRSKRHHSTPASSPRSIRETACEKPKVSTSGRKRRSGHAFTSCGKSTRAHVPPSPVNLGQRLDNEDQRQAKRAARALIDAKRHCHCDVCCKDCTDKKACPLHPGMFCSGECGRWIHASCVGLSIEETNGQLFLVEETRRIPLNALSQNENPWLCIMCRQSRSRENGDATGLQLCTFDDLNDDLKGKCLRLGLDYKSWSQDVTLTTQKRLDCRSTLKS